MTEESKPKTRPEPSLFSMLSRDIGIALIALSVWAAADTWYLFSGLWFAQLLSIGDAIFVGYILGALFHEWGHYTGAKLSGAVAPRVMPRSFSLFRFNFDMSINDQRQFHWMSFGGWALHWTLLVTFGYRHSLLTASDVSPWSARYSVLSFTPRLLKRAFCVKP